MQLKQWDVSKDTIKNNLLCADTTLVHALSYVPFLYLNGSVLSCLTNKNIPLKMIRYKNWTENEGKSRQCPKKNFERPSESFE